MNICIKQSCYYSNFYYVTESHRRYSDEQSDIGVRWMGSKPIMI